MAAKGRTMLISKHSLTLPFFPVKPKTEEIIKA